MTTPQRKRPWWRVLIVGVLAGVAFALWKLFQAHERQRAINLRTLSKLVDEPARIQDETRQAQADATTEVESLKYEEVVARFDAIFGGQK